MRSPTRILVPVDFSPCSATALEYAAHMAERLDATIDVLHVWQAPQLVVSDGSMPPLAVFAHTQAGQAMKSFLQELEARGVKPERVHGRLACGEPAQSILDVADSGRYELIVMGRHGRGRFSHLFVGSVTEKVSRRATVPVLTMHRPSEELPQPAWAQVEVQNRELDEVVT
jgi:nucleotide-binding universal stress UspA family protein